MNEQNNNTDDELSPQLAKSQLSESAINSSDAIEMLNIGSELIIRVTSPVGMSFTSKTKFIGYHSKDLILIEIPRVSKDEMNSFFQEGFWVNARAFSQRGEGAIIRFRSQIIHILSNKLAVIFLSVPPMMKINQLRKEARYEVNFSGYVAINGQKVETEVRDISRNGCRFIVSPLTQSFEVGEAVKLEMHTNPKNKKEKLLLRGRLCNLQKSRHYAKYGLSFDTKSQESVKALLSKMAFNGNKFVLKS
ncbi:MAG: flagellar brake protein [Psychromonas sp.]